MKKLLSLLTVAIITLGNNDALAQSRNEANVATLYRTSAAVDNARIHMATFDTNVKKITDLSSTTTGKTVRLERSCFKGNLD